MLQFVLWQDHEKIKHRKDYEAWILCSSGSCSWTVGGSWSTQRKPTQTQGEYDNPTQKEPQTINVLFFQTFFFIFAFI